MHASFSILAFLFIAEQFIWVAWEQPLGKFGCRSNSIAQHLHQKEIVACGQLVRNVREIFLFTFSWQKFTVSLPLGIKRKISEHEEGVLTTHGSQKLHLSVFLILVHLHSGIGNLTCKSMPQGHVKAPRGTFKNVKKHAFIGHITKSFKLLIYWFQISVCTKWSKVSLLPTQTRRVFRRGADMMITKCEGTYIYRSYY